MMARLSEMERKVDQNENKVDEFIVVYASDRERNIYSFADQIERSDYASNLLKANYVLITGMLC